MKIYNVRSEAAVGEISDFIEESGKTIFIGLPVNDLVDTMVASGSDTVGAYTEGAGYQRWDIATFEQGSFAAIEGKRPASCPRIVIDDEGVARVSEEAPLGKIALRVVFVKNAEGSRLIIKNQKNVGGDEVFVFDIGTNIYDEEDELSMSPYVLSYSQKLADEISYLLRGKMWF